MKRGLIIWIIILIFLIIFTILLSLYFFTDSFKSYHESPKTNNPNYENSEISEDNENQNDLEVDEEIPENQENLEDNEEDNEFFENTKIKPNISKDACIKIYGQGNPKETLNLFIVPINYPSDSLFYGKPSDLSDLSVNFENDVNRLLFSSNESIGYGLLTIEPFVSNLDKISVFIYPEKEYFEPGQGGVAQSFREKLFQECVYFEEKSFIHLLIGEKQEEKHSNWIGMFGSGHSSGSFRENRGENGYQGTVTIFRHELGHQFGAHDTYGPAYYNEYIEAYNNLHPEGYDDFWIFYEDLLSGKDIFNDGGERHSTLHFNCDIEPGCPKWCEGEPIPLGDMNFCAEFNSEEICNNQGSCKWYPTVNPYFKSQCIPIGGVLTTNIGTDCKEGTGCYLGCQGQGFRSSLDEDLATQWIDSKGNLYGYDLPTTEFINDVLHCCHPSNCDENDYDYSNCELFSETYEPHIINGFDRYTNCSGCN